MMEIKNIILIAIVILVALVVGIFVFSGQNSDYKNVTDGLTNITNNTTKVVNDTIINNTTQNKNNTYRVYNPQTDSYVTVIGEKFDEEVNRWYTYDTDGVRYYNTRIK